MVTFGLLVSCSPSGIMDKAEKTSGTGTVPVLGTNLRVYHAALLDPVGLHLDFPGYVVGTENLRSARQASITHVMKYVGSNGAAAKIIFENFGPEPDAVVSSAFACPILPDNGSISSLKNDIEQMLRRAAGSTGPTFTHLVLVVMGWNTDQADAIRNFNQITSNIVQASNGSFRPLVVGVTWPSLWQLSSWWFVPDAVVSATSFWAKKDQADALGRRVLAPILLDALLRAREETNTNIPIVMIGHSFGARAFVSMFREWQSVFRGITPWDSESCYKPKFQRDEFRKGDLLVLLQAAVDISDLSPNQGSILYSMLGANALTATMTASQFDSAVTTAFWANYIGSIDTFRRTCVSVSEDDQHTGSVSCGEAVGQTACHNIPSEIGWDRGRPRSLSTIYYQDASELINCRVPFGGGGAHGDFFRPEMGAFLWNEITLAKQPISP